MLESNRSKNGSPKDKVLVLCGPASEILEICDYRLLTNGKIEEFQDQEKRERVKEHIKFSQKHGLQTMMIAFCKFKEKDELNDYAKEFLNPNCMYTNLSLKNYVREHFKDKKDKKNKKGKNVKKD